MARRDDGTDGNVAVLNRPIGDIAGTDTDSANGVATDDGMHPASDEASGTSGGTRKAKRNSDELPDSDIISLNVRVPNGLRKQIAVTAVEQQTSVPQLVANMLANAYSYELPTPARAPRIKKYGSKEERLAAQKATQQRKRDVTKAILAAIESGKLDLDVDALMAEMQTDTATEAAS